MSFAALAACGDDGGAPAAELVVSTSSVTVTEGQSIEFTVALSSALKIDGAVQIAVADGAVASISPQVVTFSAGDTTPKTITVTGLDDNDLANESTTVTVSAAGVGAATIDLNVTDDDTQSLIVSTNAVAITEGGTGTFGVRLAFEPSTDTTVTIASADTARLTGAPATLTFTAANYASNQTVTLTAAEDADVATNTVDVAVASAGLTPQNVVATITDNDLLDIQTSVSSLALTEGGPAGTFQVTLTQQPASTVTINVAATSNAVQVSPAQLEFTPANYNDGSAHIVTVTPQDDLDLANHSLEISLSGGGLVGSLPVTVTDDDVQVIETNPATTQNDPLHIAEGGSETLGIRLAFDPGASITVTVASSDNSAAGVSPSQLTFDSSNYHEFQEVTVSGTQDNDLADESPTLALTAQNVNTTTVYLAVADDDTQALQLNYAGAPGTLTIAEGTGGVPNTTTVGVRLAFQPASDVTITVSSDNPDLGVTGTPVTFTPANYNVEQMVTLSAFDEVELEDDVATVTFSGGGLERTITVNIPDTDVQGFSITPATLAPIAEGGSATFHVSMNFAPDAPIVANISSSNAKILVNGNPSTQITIPTGNTAQSVQVTVIQDADAQDEVATITISDSAGGSTIPNRTVSVNGVDDDTMAFVLEPVTADIDGQRLDVIEQGADVTFQVRLTAAPASTVTVNITPSATNTVLVSSGSGFAATTTLTFSPADCPTAPCSAAMNKTVTVRGTADVNLVDEVFNITVSGPSALGAANAFVYMRKIEDDAQSILTVPTAPGPINVTEGTPQPLKVRLEYQPVSTVQVTLTGSDSDVLLNGAAAPVVLLFTTTNYDQEQTVQINTPHDVDQFDDGGKTVVVSSPALASRVIEVNMFDDDDQAIMLSKTSTTLNETPVTPNTDVFTMRLAFQPTEADETITLTVPQEFADKIDLCPPGMPNNCSDQITVTYPNTMGNGDGWDVERTITVKTQEDIDVENHTVVVGLASNRLPNATATFTVSVTDDDELNVELDQGMAQTLHEPNGDIGPPMDAPTSITYKAKLNFDPTTNLTINLASLADDKVSVSPASLTFTGGSMGNWNVEQEFTITALEDDDVGDENVQVTVSSARTPQRVLDITVEDYDQQAFVLGPNLEIHEGASASTTVRLLHQPAAGTTVSFVVSSVIPPVAGVVPGTVTVNGAATTTLTFNETTWNVNQTVTVAAPQDDDLDHHYGNLLMQAPTTGQTGQEDPYAASPLVNTIPFAVRDNDTQQIIVTHAPSALINSAQEGGPAVTFKVRLASRPRASVTDVVELVAPGQIRFGNGGSWNGNASIMLAFDVGNYAEDQTVTWFVRDTGTNVDFAGVIQLSTLDEASDQPAPFSAGNANHTTSHAVRALDDDDQSIITHLDYPTQFFGATNYTQRSNVAFGYDPNGQTPGEGIVAFTARSAVSNGNGLLGFTSRLLGPATVGPQFANPGLEATTEIVLFNVDGNGSWDVFASSDTGIVFGRFGLAGSVLLGPVIVAPAADAATDFSVARNGDVYGVIYRREQTSRNNLYFRTVNIGSGSVSSEQVSTTANTHVHFHPTLMATPGRTYAPGAMTFATPYAVIYAADGATHLHRLTATGATVGLHTFDKTGPFPGDFASAYYDPVHEVIWAAAVHKTGDLVGENAVFLHQIGLPADSSAAELWDSIRLTWEPMAPVGPPAITRNVDPAPNLGDIAVAYDSNLGGINQVGVALFNYGSGPRDFRLDETGDEGVYPSITWAGDRWILRYQANDPGSAGIRLRSGAFEGSSQPL